MKRIQFAMCDDRLIHGQIIRRWMHYLHFEKVIIVDDAIADDVIEKKILALAAPTDLPVQVVSCTEFLEMKEEKGNNVFVIFGNLATIEKLLEIGIKIEVLNIGRIPAGVGRTKLEKAMYLSQEDLELLHLLLKKGIQVFVQMVPEDEKIEVKERLASYEKEFGA